MKKNKKFNDREKDPKKGFYPGGVLNILEAVYSHKNFKQLKTNKELPVFNEKEVKILVAYIFYKPKGWRVVEKKFDNKALIC